jgi:hypothetical protein
MAVVLFFFAFRLFLGPALGRGRMSSEEKGRVSSFEVDIDGPVESIESIDVFGVLLLPLQASAATGGVDIHLYVT